MVDSASHFSDEQKLVMLQNAVESVDALATVQTTAAQIKTTLGQDITFERYCQLLISAASQHDAKVAKAP